MAPRITPERAKAWLSPPQRRFWEIWLQHTTVAAAAKDAKISEKSAYKLADKIEAVVQQLTTHMEKYCR